MTQSIKINPDNTLTATLSDGKSYTLREPRTKDLDGLSQDLIKIKHTDQVQKLLERTSTPRLSRADYGKLSISDADVLNACLNFFLAPPTAARRTHHCQTDTHIAAGRFNNYGIFTDFARFFNGFNHRFGDAVFHAAAGIEKFQFDGDFGFQTFSQTV